MKKQKLVLTGLVGFAFLFGCSQVDDGEVSAGDNLPKGFTQVTTKQTINYTDIVTIKNDFTGCFYIITDGSSSGDLEQMFIEKDGVTVPYCDKVGE